MNKTIKRNLENSPAYWWLRSTNSHDDNFVACVNAYDGVYYNYYDNTLEFAPAFVI